ncbi:hypothetical protein [Domibacillus mangrovi]|nr:hypothetical protein [Domibacillus mangrovi]
MKTWSAIGKTFVALGTATVVASSWKALARQKIKETNKKHHK